MTTAATIYDKLGGADTVTRVVDIFYGLVLADETLAPHFAATDLAQLKDHQRKFVAAALGGPDLYKGRRLDAAHAGLNIPDAAFDRTVSLLVAAILIAGADVATAAGIGGSLDGYRGWIVTAGESEPARG